MKILIGTPTFDGNYVIDMETFLMCMEKPIPFGFSKPKKMSIDVARNLLMMQTIQGGFDYLFMIDDDMELPFDVLPKLLEADKDIIGVGYLSKYDIKDGKNKLLAMVQSKKGQEYDYKPFKDFKKGQELYEVDVIGTGAILIKRHVLEDLYKHYNQFVFEFRRDEYQTEKNKKDNTVEWSYVSEDYVFCQRARRLGYKVWLHAGIPTKHCVKVLEKVEFNPSDYGV